MPSHLSCCTSSLDCNVFTSCQKDTVCTWPVTADDWGKVTGVDKDGTRVSLERWCSVSHGVKKSICWGGGENCFTDGWTLSMASLSFGSFYIFFLSGGKNEKHKDLMGAGHICLNLNFRQNSP